MKYTMSNTSNIRVGVVGATGYAGVELVSLLIAHPEMELVCAASSSQAGVPLSSAYPRLAVLGHDVTLCSVEELLALDLDLVFLAVPHTTSMELVPKVLARGARVIDLSADYRIKDAGLYEAYYHVSHTHEALLASAVYGLPELNREEIVTAALVANPGCYPTATALGAIPLLEQGIGTGTPLIVDAKSGMSGAGRTPDATTHYCNADESLKAYKPCVHQHIPEIEQTLSLVAGSPVQVTFVPHLAPYKRGLLSSIYILSCVDSPSIEELFDLYVRRYADEPFVSVCQPPSMPDVATVACTNQARIGLAKDERTGVITVSTAIDNLGKGAASQAVQCANIMFGFDETAGLVSIQGVV